MMRPYVSLDDLFELVSVLRNNPSLSHREILDIIERMPKVMVDPESTKIGSGPPSSLIKFKSGDLYEFMLKYKRNQESLGRGFGKLFGFTIVDIILHENSLTIKYLDEDQKLRELTAEKGGTQGMPELGPPTERPRPPHNGP